MNIGRNDPCNCGSGKKYKKCCLLKEYEQQLKEEKEFQEWFEKDCELGQKLLKEYQDELKITLDSNNIYGKVMATKVN
jgi:hypothetical protein